MGPIRFSERYSGRYLREFIWSGLLPQPRNPPSSVEFGVLLHFKEHLRASMLEEIESQATQLEVEELFLKILGLTPAVDPPYDSVSTLLMNTGKDAWNAILAMKESFDLGRPSQFEPALEPAVAVPNYAAFPSGHATLSMIAALVSASLLPMSQEWNPLRMRLFQTAFQVGRNREIAGLHFPSDTENGIYLAFEIFGAFAGEDYHELRTRAMREYQERFPHPPSVP